MTAPRILSTLLMCAISYGAFARDYEAQTGRYVESDPLGQAADVSTYGYVSGSPLIGPMSTGF